MAPLDPLRLQSFLAVASQGSFSAAARALGKTQPSVSQAVALLERELGARLFVRDGRRTRLSDEGRRLRPLAEGALAALARARQAVAAAGTLDAGQLNIGTSDTLAFHLLPPVLAAFRARHPQIELRLVNRPSPAVAALCAEGEVDLGLVTLPLPAGLRAGGQPITQRLTFTPLCKQEDALITPRGHPLGRRQRVSLEALADEPLVLLDPSTATRAFLDDAFARRGLHPRVAMEMNSVQVVKRLVELGFGLSVIPAMALARTEAPRPNAREAGPKRQERQKRQVHARPWPSQTDGVDVARLTGLPPRQVALVTPARAPVARAAEAFGALARELLRGR